jgi:hypothetical protein
MSLHPVTVTRVTLQRPVHTQQNDIILGGIDFRRDRPFLVDTALTLFTVITADLSFAAATIFTFLSVPAL